LAEDDLLDHYLHRAKQARCTPITRVTPGYPLLLRKQLGEDAPGCLWANGNLSLLEQPAIALVGSRDLKPENLAFAREAGRQAALQGLVLISGNARGADQAAQKACSEAGGRVISIVADELFQHAPDASTLYLSEDAFDTPFSAQRALSRNRCIHTLGRAVLVAQATLQKGGTWDGTSKNLRFGWSNVCCFQDGSDAARVLTQMGAEAIDKEDLQDLSVLFKHTRTFFDP
jgi:predicted Rossmann fold nucleotide-binding protein DprA/Smf involved in DNA uptake